MTDIPDDIWTQVGAMYAGFDPPSPYEVAVALAAERERSASIAREHARALRKNYDHSSARAVEGVLAAILAPPIPLPELTVSDKP